MCPTQSRRRRQWRWRSDLLVATTSQGFTTTRAANVILNSKGLTPGTFSPGVRYRHRLQSRGIASAASQRRHWTW
jgi:hypothetical protein